MEQSSDVEKSIKNKVSLLTLDWFSQKEKEFKANGLYNELKDNIECVGIEFNDEDENDIEAEADLWDDFGYSVDFEIDLRRYCDCYLPINETTGWGRYPSSDGLQDELRLFNIDELSSDLLNIIEIFSKDIDNDNELFFKYISKVLGIIKKELDSLKTLFPKNIIYNNVLDDFFEKCVSKIHAKYERKLATYNLTADHKGKLEFSMRQDRLLALIFIIQRCQFFNSTSNSPFLIFCFEHFLYEGHNGKMVTPKSLLNLQKKYNAITNSQNPNSKQVINHKGLEFVKRKLSDILKNL